MNKRVIMLIILCLFFLSGCTNITSIIGGKTGTVICSKEQNEDDIITNTELEIIIEKNMIQSLNLNITVSSGIIVGRKILNNEIIDSLESDILIYDGKPGIIIEIDDSTSIYMLDMNVDYKEVDLNEFMNFKYNYFSDENTIKPESAKKVLENNNFVCEIK